MEEVTSRNVSQLYGTQCICSVREHSAPICESERDTFLTPHEDNGKDGNEPPTYSHRPQDKCTTKTESVKDLPGDLDMWVQVIRKCQARECIRQGLAVREE